MDVPLEPATCYRALRSHDPRFDGRFFVGVSSTGIYCRPVCTVRAPKPANCTFYSSAAAAESAGYRPCLRCRPELAPGNSSVDAKHRIAHSAAAMIQRGALEEIGLEGIAARLGVTGRHLRRVFGAEFGVTLVAFGQTHRLLLAKRFLTDTALPVTDVAFAAGFGSLRRLENLFKERYRLSPYQLRKTAAPSTPSDALHFELSYRPPYDWPSLASFLSARAIAGVEAVDGSAYHRIVRLSRNGKWHSGWIEIVPHPRKSTMRVAISASLASVLPAVLSRIEHLLDLSCSPTQIAEALGPLAAANPGLRVPGAFDGFEIAVRAILGQQVSVAAARTLAGRVAAAFGTPVDSPFPSLTTAFPPAQAIADANLTALGILPSRARSILELARAVAQGDLVLAPGADVPATLEKLQSIPGIGPWTAHYIAMRALAWPDAFPHTDLAVMKALGEKNPKRILAAGEAWRPWRAYAVMHLWNHTLERTPTNGTAN